MRRNQATTDLKTVSEKQPLSKLAGFALSGSVPTSFTLTVSVLAVADGLFGLYGWERSADERIFVSTHPPPPWPVPNKPCGFCGRKAPCQCTYNSGRLFKSKFSIHTADGILTNEGGPCPDKALSDVVTET